jgi:AcrR family transcriptional regulator
MAVYTYFGGMPGVVRAVIREGFTRLADRLALVAASDDPVADGFQLAIAYRESAHERPHLYAVMFGGSTIAGFELSDEDRRIGLYTLRAARDMVPRCIRAGRFREAEPWSVARHMWCQLHGLVSLELAGYLPASRSGADEFRQYLQDFAVGAGDAVELAGESAARAFAAVAQRSGR